MKDETTLKPGLSITIGILLSILLYLIVQITIVNLFHSQINKTDFYQNLIGTGYEKLLLYGSTNLISISLSIIFFIFGLGESHEIPEITEHNRKIEELRKKQLGLSQLDSDPILIWPVTAKADFVPPEGYTGFYLWLGSPIRIFLSAGNHWRIPLFSSIRIVQTAPVSSEFVGRDYCKIKNKIPVTKQDTIVLQELAGSVNFTARGLITYFVYDPITYYQLDESTKQLNLISYVKEGCRDHIRSHSPETLMNETSKKELKESLSTLINGLDGDGNTIEELGLEVAPNGIKLEDLEPTNPKFRAQLEAVPESQLKEFTDLLRYDNHAKGIKRLKKAGVQNLEKASENILAMDKDAKMAIQRNEDQIEFVGDAKSDGAILALIRNYLNKKK